MDLQTIAIRSSFQLFSTSVNSLKEESFQTGVDAGKLFHHLFSPIEIFDPPGKIPIIRGIVHHILDVTDLIAELDKFRFPAKQSRMFNLKLLTNRFGLALIVRNLLHN